MCHRRHFLQGKNADGMNASLGGHVKVYFSQVPAVLQHGEGSAPDRITTTNACPTCPTCRPSRAWLSGMRSAPGRAFVRARRHIEEVVNKIGGEVVRMLKSPDIRERIEREAPIRRHHAGEFTSGSRANHQWPSDQGSRLQRGI